MERQGWRWVLSIGTMLVGIWIGCRVREAMTGKPAYAFVFQYVNEADGRSYRSVPVSTKLWPALLLTWMGKWQPVNGLLAGLVVGGALDDRFEAAWVRWILSRTQVSR